MTCMRSLRLALIFAIAAATGCTKTSEHKSAAEDKGTTKAASESPDHVHGEGPNGGVVFDLGKYHAEFTVDHDKKQCMVVVLGDDEKTPAAVAASELTLTTKETKTETGTTVPPMTITLKAKNAANGKAAEFVGTDDGLGNVADFEGAVIGEIDGKPSQGEFQE